jgi:hypothetical protein
VGGLLLIGASSTAATLRVFVAMLPLVLPSLATKLMVLFNVLGLSDELT